MLKHKVHCPPIKLFSNLSSVFFKSKRYIASAPLLFQPLMDRVSYETYDVYDSMDVNPTEEQVISLGKAMTMTKTKVKTMASVQQ